MTDHDGSNVDGDGGPSVLIGSTDSPAVRRLADWNATRLSDLTDEYGSPLYVTDLDRVAENCARLDAAFPDADLRYAMKANSSHAVLETVRDAGFGVECASAGEVRRALDAGFDGGDVDYTAVNPPARDLDAVVRWWDEGADVSLTIGAADTLDRLRERGYDGRICVRVNPGIGAGHHEKVETGSAAKFGVPVDSVGDVVAAARADFDLVGLHAHAGSGIHGEDDLAAHREFLAQMADLAAEHGPVEYVNVGGGIGVPYHEDEPPLDLDGVAEAVRDELGILDATLALEPGRYVVADAAVLVTRVHTVKETPDELVAGVDAGMTDLLRPAMYDAYHPIRSMEPDPADRETDSVTVAGPICESGDVFCEDRSLPTPERGDILALGNAGAYGYEMASTYNSQPRPADVTLAGELLRRRETLADITRLES